MVQVLKNIWYSFQVQLLLMHLKKHQILLLMWVLLFLVVTGNFGKLYGVPYLFLDPEYLGKVDYLSFSLVGAAFGGFLMTWNITTYILESARFPFLAAFERPFAVYVFNNSLIPLAFFICYFIAAVQFQANSEFAQSKSILLDMAGFVSGMVIIIFIASVYFQTTNKNIFNLFNVKLKEIKRIRKQVVMREDSRWEALHGKDAEFRVDYYMTMSLGVRPVRNVQHYNPKMLREVFRQNHLNAFFIESATLATVIGLGFLIDYEIFRLPAAVSAILFLAILTSLAGVLDFWFKTWKTVVLVAIIVLVNGIILRYDLLTYKNQAFGINYDVPPAEYSYATLDSLSSPDNIRRDKLNTLAILDAWKAHTGERKPKLIIMNFSGGGLSSATFSTAVMQAADSATNGQLLKHTVLMTGASGGMIGAAYIRELYLRSKQNEISSIYNDKYPMNISKDLLNSTLFTWVTNDLFFPFQSFEVNGRQYKKDRGYMLEKQLNENINGYLTRTLGYYDEYEKAGIIPMLLFSPTIINDQRRLFICAQPVSYLTRPTGQNYRPSRTDVDGIDFMTFFKDQQPEDLLLSSAIRMNCTYPYILPYVTLPTEPITKVMDAGFRDNYGLSTTARFISTFKDWINDNTSGVIIVQSRQYKKEREIEGYENETLLSGLVSPLTSIYSNLSAVQDYEQGYQMSAVSDALRGKLDVITFEYNPESKDEEASLSFHLTTKERMDIVNTVHRPYVRENIDKLKELLK